MDKHSLKVLMISSDIAPRPISGVGRHVQELTDALSNLGVSITLLVPHKEQYAQNDDVHIIPVSNPPATFADYSDLEYVFLGRLAMTLDLNAAMIASLYNSNLHDFDLIHCHDLFLANTGYHLARLSRKPLVVTKHTILHLGQATGYENNLSRLFEKITFQTMRAFEKRLLDQCDGIIAVSQDTLDYTSSLLDNPKFLVQLPNATRFINYNADSMLIQNIRAKYCPNGENLVLMVGRLAYNKGFHVLIKAVKLIEHLNAKYVIIGEGIEKDNLHMLVQSLNLTQHVFFEGYIQDPELCSWYAASDVVIAPSLREPFGIVVIEAMSFGKPVVGTAVGGIRQIITDGINGALVPQNDEQALSRAIQAMIENKDKAAALGERARSDIQEKYTWERVASRTLDAYRQIMHSYGYRNKLD